jgi:hypothetical protein
LTRLVHQLDRAHATRAIHHQLANEVMRQSPPDHRPAFGLELALTVFHEPLAPRGLSRDRLHALARAQARFSSGWVSFCLLLRFMELTDRFGCVGLNRHDGDWLHAFALEHCQHQAPHFAPKPMIEALEGLYDVLVEQYYDFAEALADRYVVMERGEVIASGPGSEMQAKGVRQLVAI